MRRLRSLVTLSAAFMSAALGLSAYAADEAMEEIIVTARQQSETLQDVPVTIAAMTEEDLDRYNITNLVDAAKMVPNMVISHGGSGNGSSLRLRGIGSSSISAAFDHSVALNLDGVVVNRGRFIHNSYMDMQQLEVLKGPQSLYFGKSATAGVASITTNDPGDEFEFQISGGVETEYEGTFGEVIISGPITDTFGARLAVGYNENDELFENFSAGRVPTTPAGVLAPVVAGTKSHYGDESLNARLTLVWDPTDTFTAKLKYNYSEYENDGAGTAWAEDVCPEGAHEPTGIPAASAAFLLFQGVDDCRINGNTSKLNLHPALDGGLPGGWSDGVPGLEQETDFISLRMDWDFHEDYTLTAVTGWVDLAHEELDDYSYGAGVFGGLHYNDYESISQEFRLSSHTDNALNFQAGILVQEIEQEFDAYQYAFNLGIIAGPDPVTGNEYDYNKHHFLDTDVFSAYLAFYWDINEKTELTFGARYTDEEKDGKIEIPYLHAAAGAFGFGAPPLIDGLEFEDDNISPEIAINYYVTDDVSVFAAYKEGFKSGGLDNSALPTAALDPANNGGDFSFLEYESEEADGFEIGMKGNFRDGALRVNATIFTYEYSDLQVQLFDSNTIQFQTFNASALETEGLEFDFLWHTEMEGLTFRGAWAWTDTTYSEDFINATDENLKGEDGAGNANITGFVGGTYDWSVSSGWRMSLSTDFRYTGEYDWTATLDPFEQDDFWIVDAALSVYSEDGTHQFNLIGRNLGDEIYITGGGAIPGRCPGAIPGANPINTPPNLVPPNPGPYVCNPTGPNSLDQAATTQLGRTLTLQYRYTLNNN